jgi:hypothetical protein
MSRDRIYGSNAERQRAYRERKRQEEEDLRRRAGQSSRPWSRPSRRKDVPGKLLTRVAQILGMLGSEFPGERDTAARMATKIVKDAGFTWYDILDAEEN